MIAPAQHFSEKFMRSESRNRRINAHAATEARIRKVGDVYVLDDSLWLPRPIEQVFKFFSDAMNLARITPDFLRFQITSPLPIIMDVGTLIDYRLKVRGVPIRWRSQITEWDPPFGFVDEQLHGPYRIWRHEHRFMPETGGTRISDRVEFISRGGPVAHLLHRVLVNRDVRMIFAHRKEALASIFADASTC